MKNEKNIPFKNYIFLSMILIVSIVVIIYFYMWYSEIEESKINTPIMDDYLSVINYNELDDYLIENKDVLIYVSVLNNDKIRNFENKFKKKVNEYSLNNKILYLNLTGENNKTVNSFMKEYNVDSLPCLTSFKNGKVTDVYTISNSNYDIDLLISYLRIEGVIDD